MMMTMMMAGDGDDDDDDDDADDDDDGDGLGTPLPRSSRVVPRTTTTEAASSRTTTLSSRLRAPRLFGTCWPCSRGSSISRTRFVRASASRVRASACVVVRACECRPIHPPTHPPTRRGRRRGRLPPRSWPRRPRSLWPTTTTTTPTDALLGLEEVWMDGWVGDDDASRGGRWGEIRCSWVLASFVPPVLASWPAC